MGDKKTNAKAKAQDVKKDKASGKDNAQDMKKPNDIMQDAIPVEPSTVIDVAVAKLLSAHISNPQTIEACNALLKTHYNRPHDNFMVNIKNILQNKDAMADIQSLLTLHAKATAKQAEKTAKIAMYHRIFLGIGFCVLIASVVVLSYFEKLDPSAGVILGALGGYLFGKER